MCLYNSVLFTFNGLIFKIIILTRLLKSKYNYFRTSTGIYNFKKHEVFISIRFNKGNKTGNAH